MEHRREVLRIPAMRQSIFLVPAETAPRIFAATGLPMEKHSRRLRYAGLDWDEYTRLKQTVLEHLGDRMLVKLAPFERGILPRSLYERAFDGVGQVLGATAVEVLALTASN